MIRDWRRLPYWGSQTEVESTIGDIYKSLAKAGLENYRVTRQATGGDWTLIVQWEQVVGESPVLVTIDATVSTAELKNYTPAQGKAILRQAARLLWHTIKNLLAAEEAGFISLNEIFLSRMQTWTSSGEPTTVGALMLEKIAAHGTLGPVFERLQLPAAKS